MYIMYIYVYVYVMFRPQACKFIKNETLAQVFSCEFCEILKNFYFYKTPLVAASERNRAFILETYESCPYYLLCNLVNY